MRRLGLLIFFFIGLLNASCRREDSHLSSKQLAPILADLHIADVYSGMVKDDAHPNGGKNYDSLAVWTKSILARYKVTQQEFNQSMDWYRDRPLELDSLYANVLPILGRNRK